MRRVTLVILLLLAGGSLPSLAAELPEVGKIEVPRVSPYDDEEDNFDQSHNLSGLFCPAAGWCVTVSDEKRGFHRLKVARDQNGVPAVSHDAILSLGKPSDEFLQSHGLTGSMKEFDLEAIAAAGDHVYFLGSHANKRRQGTPNPGAHLIAVASVSDLKSRTEVPAEWTSLDGLFKVDTVLGPALNKQLQCGGLNIEGATALGTDLLIGVRIPSQGTDGAKPAVFVVSTPLDGLLAGDFSAAKRHVLSLDTPFIGIRAMETSGDSAVVITGDAGVSDLRDDATPECGSNTNKENPSRPFQLRIWKPASGDAFEAQPVVTFDPVMENNFDDEPSLAKLEAIAADPARPGAFFILYDGSDKVRYLDGVTLP